MSEKKEYLYETIKKDLLAKIKNGTYKIGEVIPKEEDLVLHYNVSRPTIRQAINSLVSDGYLERRKKGGTKVIRKKIHQEFTHVIQSYDNEIKNSGMVSKTVVLNFNKVEKIEKEILDVLCPKDDENIYKLVRLRYANEEPNVCVISHIKISDSVDLMEYDFSELSLYSILNSLGIPVKEITRNLEVVKADLGMSTLLAVNPDDPLFKFKSIGYTHNHNPIEYSKAYYRGDTNSFVIKLRGIEK